MYNLIQVVYGGLCLLPYKYFLPLVVKLIKCKWSEIKVNWYQKYIH